MRVTKPDIYYDMATADYFADPCPSPSFTQSLAKLVLARSPWHAREQHPRLNPNYQPDNGTRFDIGNCAHAILLGRGKALTVIDADDWRTKAAKDAREKGLADGKLCVLRHQYDAAGEMVRSAQLQLAGRFGLGSLFGDGNAEVVLAWEQDGVWFRTMIDWLSADHRTVVDFKTTQASAAPAAIPMKMATDGWVIQAAMHELGLDALNPASAGRRTFLYLCQECEPPYALSVSRIREAPLTMGRRQLGFAIERWRKCLLTDKWDGYEGIGEPEYPSHLETRWLEREIEAEQPVNLMAAG